MISPWDEHNQRLVQAVHPPGWANPVPRATYDMVVIGAGTAGLVCAAGAAGLGAKVALIERHLMGGDCLNTGCVPSKALLHAAHTARARGETPPFAAVMERLRRVRADIAPHDSAERFRKLGVDVFLGEAHFSGPRSITVGDAALRFKRAVVATGARAAVPEIQGLAGVPHLTNESIFELTTLPARLLILGAGPIGVEMAQAFQRLGSAVTLVDQAPRVLPREDPDAAAAVAAALATDGVNLLLGAAVERVEPGAASIGGTRVAFDALLIALGRTPNVEGLGLEAAGVQYDPRRGVHVDDHLRTANARVFACGDVCMQHKFTHAAHFAARNVIQNALFFGRKRLSALHIPWCTYTAPEVAHVGLTAEEAQSSGIAVDTFTVEMAKVDRAILDETDRGFFRVHVRKGTDKIAGATMVSAHAGESIQTVVLAMNHKIGLGRIAAMICPYPVEAEAIRMAGDLYSRTRLTPRSARLLKAMIRLNR